MTHITADIARKLLIYSPKTGKLTWRPRPETMPFLHGYYGLAGITVRPEWNTKFAGKPAFTSRRLSGYQGLILGENFLAQKIIWLMMTGDWPAGAVKHRDGDNTNNAWNNLFLLPQAIADYQPHRGVRRTAGGRWLAAVGKDRLGVYDSYEAALAARKAAILHRIRPSDKQSLAAFEAYWSAPRAGKADLPGAA